MEKIYFTHLPVNADLFPSVYFLALCLFNLDYYRFST